MPAPQRLKELFDYKDGHLHYKSASSNRKAGARAGTLKDNGYIVVSIGPSGSNRRFREHQLIWVMHNGFMPLGTEIDHINHVRSDNRIENLRLVTRATNRRNVSLASNNTSGVTGVYFNNSLQLWCARINNDEGEMITLGCRKDKSLAVKLRKEAEKIYGYHKNHGQPMLERRAA